MKWILIILILFPKVVIGQGAILENEVKWFYNYQLPKNNCRNDYHYRIRFYQNNNFEYQGSLHFDQLVGEGKYEIKDSIITCIYNGDAACTGEVNYNIELIEDENNKIEIIVEDYSEERLIGAEILLKNDNAEIIDTLICNIDGIAILPINIEFSSIEINYTGLESIKTKIYGNLKTDIKFTFGWRCTELIIIKGIKQEFKIIDVVDRQIKLIEINRGENFLITK